MTLTTSHLTADTESGRHVFLRQAFTRVFQNKSLPSEKQNYVCCCCLFDCTL